MGRAARHIRGSVILYADRVTVSMDHAMQEVKRRRHVQILYNTRHHITPASIIKPIRGDIVREGIRDFENSILKAKDTDYIESLTPYDREKLVKKLRLEMRQAGKRLEFEEAAHIRDLISQIQKND